jgi:CRP/FNR family transcriptional regulator, cyclic AMP receptor protein
MRMETRTPDQSQVCRVLDEDSELGDVVSPEHREQAARECLARTFAVPAGRWRAPQTALASEGIGLLVLRGLLIRRVGVDGRFGAELLGVGDLLRPWQREDEPPTLPVTTGWRVVEPARMAVLDARFAQRVGRYPPAIGCLVGRAVARSRNLAVNMAIVHQARVDVRLHMLFWQLAARWGKVRSDGVNLPLRLTHKVLADLAAARRPTVTSALSELARQDLVHAAGEGWLLAGQPQGELLELVDLSASLTHPRHLDVSIRPAGLDSGLGDPLTP